MDKFLILKVHLKEPVKTDLSYIQGSTLRGAYIRKYITKNNINEDISLNKEYREKLLTKGLKFFNAYPYVDNNYSIPTPLCFYTSKDDSKKFDKEVNEVDIKNEFSQKYSIDEGDKRVNKRDYSFIDKNVLNLIGTKKIENLHTRKIKDTKKENDIGDLFRYIAIDKEQVFYSVIKCDENLVNEVIQTIDNEIIYLGGSKGSGYGRCNVSVDKVLNYDELKKLQGISCCNNTKNDDLEKSLSIYFLSDTIIKDEFGQITSHISPKYIEKKLQIKDVKYTKGSVITTETKGYNATIKSSLPSVVAIKSGSILTYSYKGNLDINDINEFEIHGVGIRKQDGYGRVILNPNFDVNVCKIHKNKDKLNNINKNIDKNSKDTLSNILNNINKQRVENILKKIVIESIDSNIITEVVEGKINLKNNRKVKIGLSRTQIGRLINLLDQCERESNDKKSKDRIKKFRRELKTKSKKSYANKSQNQLFGYPLYIEDEVKEKNPNQKDYFDVLASDISINELTNTNLELNIINKDDLNINKDNNYRLKLKLTKEILHYTLRKGSE